MKKQYLSLILSLSFAACAAGQTPPPTRPAATPAPPPAAPPKRSAADLEKLVAPIALYPDSLIATMLPASVYPLEIVQAARFVADTNNLAKLDEQPWDENVKNVARVPAAIKKLNDDLPWTMELGDAFLAQDKDLMDAIQSMRGKAQKAGTLQTTPQQIVTVTNLIVEKTVEQKVVVVTNTVVQIQPSNPQVVYVPSYPPSTVYYPPRGYVYSPAAPLVTFGVGMMVGAAIANNNCNWNNGGCYHGSGNVNINVNNNNNVNVNNNNNVNRNNNANSSRSTSANQAGAAGGQQKWQPDQSRMAKSGSPSAANSTGSAQARGYSSGGASPSTASAGARPSTGTAGARPTTGTPLASKPTASPSASQTRSSPAASPAASRSSSSGSAFSGASSGASASASSSRGTSSRSSGASSGGGGGRSGGGGGGGGRR